MGSSHIVDCREETTTPPAVARVLYTDLVPAVFQRVGVAYIWSPLAIGYSYGYILTSPFLRKARSRALSCRSSVLSYCV